jgi:hypothetical protein
MEAIHDENPCVGATGPVHEKTCEYMISLVVRTERTDPRALNEWLNEGRQHALEVTRIVNGRGYVIVRREELSTLHDKIRQQRNEILHLTVRLMNRGIKVEEGRP